MKELKKRILSFILTFVLLLGITAFFSGTIFACFQNADCNCNYYCDNWFFGNCVKVGATSNTACGDGYFCQTLTTIWNHALVNDPNTCELTYNNDYNTYPDCSYWRGTTVNGVYDQMDPNDWSTTRWQATHSCSATCGSMCGASGTTGCYTGQTCDPNTCGCVPTCQQIGGSCYKLTPGCPAGTNMQDNNATDSCNYPPSVALDYLCCTKTPDCTNGASNCTSCGGPEPYNTCGTYTGGQTCYHDTSSNTTTTPVCKTVPFYPSCSYSYDTCDNTAGYTCGSGSVCRKTMGGKVTSAETGAGISGVTITTSSGNTTTAADGSWSVAGFGYQKSFTITPATSGSPCNKGYVCGGTNPTSPNPGSRAGTVGGSGDCGMNCNFTYTPGHIGGHVYIDYNHNGTKDTEDVGINGVTISATNTSTGTLTDTTATGTDGTVGEYDISPLDDGAHTITITVPAGYQIVGSTSQSVTIGPNSTTTDFYITPLYTLSGIIYNDYDAGKCYNPTTSGCTDQSVSPSVSHGPGIDTVYNLSQTTVTVVGDGKTFTLNQSDGTYNTGQTLRSGTYTVSLTTVPTDYHMTYPLNGVPAYFSNINIGTPGKSYACDTNNANDATCDVNGNMSFLNFGMNNENGHGGGICVDVRDEISTSQYVPDNATCGVLSGQYYIYGNSSCPTGPSIYFSGTETPDFGHGTANVNNWIAGGATSESFSPVNPGIIRTSSSYLNTTLTQNAITPTDLSTVCTPSDCYLPDNLPSGVYTYPFDTTFVGTKVSGGGTIDGTYTFPTGANYVFVTGDSTHQSSMTFKTKMLVPNGSTATFTTSKDMMVDPSVGESDITSTKGDLEGFYSADESFIIESAYTADNRCTDTGGTKDLRLNIIGSVIVNAAEKGGSFVNDRDLCAGDLTCPTYTTGNGDGGDNGGGGSGDTTGTDLGLTYILNAPDLIKHKNSFWQELAP